MATYIGTPTSRIDGHAKVTGAAKYAAEFNVPGLAYASIIASTIAKGRIARIDTRAALRVDGVIDRIPIQSQFRIMELELIEPALFLTSHAEAAETFADAIANAVQSRISTS